MSNVKVLKTLCTKYTVGCCDEACMPEACMPEISINSGTVQQGWQCPICFAVYSPLTKACLNCLPQLKITSENNAG